MKTFFFKIFLVAFIAGYAQHIKAQEPSWSVNSSDYQYSMTFTAFLNVNGKTLTNSSDKVAAFINGEVRGVSNVVYEASADKYVTYLTVYSNSGTNDVISFKIYDSSEDLIVNVSETNNFKIDENIGGIFQSYSIALPTLNAASTVNSFSFNGISSISEEILENEIKIIVPENTDLTTLKAVFETSTNSKVYVDTILQESGVSIQNFTEPIRYKVLSENEEHLKEYLVSVVVNTSPISVTITTTDDLVMNTTPVTVDVSFSRSVAGFTPSDLELINAVVHDFTTIDTQTFRLTLIPLSQGDFSIEVPSNSVLDIDDNPNDASNKLLFTYDISKPIISNISLDSNSSSFSFLVTFNENVVNVDKEDFELTGVASKDLIIGDAILISEKEVRIDVTNTNTNQGIISLQLKQANDIKDIAGNSLAYLALEGYLLTKRSITITADAKTKVYGTADPALTYTITSGSLYNESDLTGSLSREPGEDVGIYTINKGTLSLTDNYTMTYIPANFEILNVLNVDDDILNNQIQLYPNPTKNVLYIKNSTSLKVEKIIIYTILGQAIKKEKDVDTFIDMNAFSKGTYFVKIHTQKGVLFKKVIKR